MPSNFSHPRASGRYHAGGAGALYIRYIDIYEVLTWPLSSTAWELISGLVKTKSGPACKRYHAGTGYMHEAFHRDDFGKFSRPWFAGAHTLFDEFSWKV